MAGSLQLTFNSRLTDGNGSPIDQIQPLTTTIAVAAVEMASGIQVVGTSDETVILTDVTTLGYGYFQNLDSTNFLEIGPDSTGLVSFAKLLPGEWCCLPLTPGITVKAKADTLAVSMLYKVFGR